MDPFFLSKDYRSPLDPPSPSPKKTKEQREQEALHDAMEKDRQNLRDPQAARINELERAIADMRPTVEELKTLHGEFPMKVTGDIVSIDPSAIGGGNDRLQFRAFDAWENGALVSFNLATG